MSRRGRRRSKKISSDKLTIVRERDEEMVNNISNREAPYSDELPEFFTLYKPALNSETMRIPPDFVENFGGNIPTVCTLITHPPTEVSWKVEMNKINDDWFLQTGWPEFVQENSLEDGEFLIFSYAANSTFYVKIFIRNGCIKRSENTSMVDDDQPTENLQENEEADQSENQVDKRATKRPRSKSPMARNSVRKNPSYLLTITKSYISKGSQPIPIAFWKSYMRKKYKEGSNKATLWVQNNPWNVELRFEIDRVSWGKGSTDFVRGNSLKVGNSCTFELIDGDELAFKVIIHRWIRRFRGDE